MDSDTGNNGQASLTRYQVLDQILGRGNYRSIAILAGYTPSHIGRTLRGVTNDVSLSCAAKIAEVADVTIDDVHYFIQANKRKRVRRKEHLRAAIAKRGKLVADAEARQ